MANAGGTRWRMAAIFEGIWKSSLVKVPLDCGLVRVELPLPDV